jgi:NADPH-dependent 2,4-dienoyl-CoA reductase/sulfur reductase-like enzyme
VLGPELGDFVRALLEKHGIAFAMGEKAVAIDRDAVRLESGRALPADLVVAGVGVKPRTALAEAVGLAVDDGVLVDEFLETKVRGVFAAGDIARYPEPRTGKRVRIEHWVVAERQGQAAARNLLGRRRPFDAVPFFWTHLFDAALSYVGHAAAWDAIEVHGSLAGHDATVAYRQGGRVLAVANLFRNSTSLRVEAAMERGDEAELDSLVAR